MSYAELHCLSNFSFQRGASSALELFERIRLRDGLTPQRSNGLRSMVERIRAEAKAALAPA